MHLQVIDKNIKDNSLQLSPIAINEDYRKEWSIREKDFVCLTRGGELINNSLLRVGGIGGLNKDGYSLLLKHVEAIYDYDFIKTCYPNKSAKELELQRKHLEGRWCIFDKNGIEKVEFKQFASPYLLKDSCIYSVNNNYYNIETGELYCQAYHSVSSTDFLFLENDFDKDVSKRGIMKINKKDGTFELFK